MPYESNTAGLTWIGEHNFRDYTGEVAVGGEVKGRGFIRRDWDRFPLGSFAEPFPLPLIPRSEWRDRIEARDRAKAWPKDHKLLSGFTSLDQGSTNYCWINATTQAVHYCRAMQGLPHVALSPASVGGPMKNYRNVGGWGSEGLQYIIDHGLVPQSMWPANAIDRQYDTDATRAVRENYRVTEWWELREQDFEQLVSCLLYGYSVSAGYNWWSHQILACKVVVRGRDDFGIDIDNSWGTEWESNGHAILTEAKGTPDDACAPRVATPSG